MANRPLVLAALTLGVVGLYPALTLAHDLQVLVRLPPAAPTELVVEAGFDDDTPAEEARVTITDAAGVVVARGVTDARGICRLSRPGPGHYTAVVEQAGHRDAVGFVIVGAADAGADTFAGRRFDKTLGLALGGGGLLVMSFGYAWLRNRRRSA